MLTLGKIWFMATLVVVALSSFSDVYAGWISATRRWQRMTADPLTMRNYTQDEIQLYSRQRALWSTLLLAFMLFLTFSGAVDFSIF